MSIVVKVSLLLQAELIRLCCKSVSYLGLKSFSGDLIIGASPFSLYLAAQKKMCIPEREVFLSFHRVKVLNQHFYSPFNTFLPPM